MNADGELYVIAGDIPPLIPPTPGIGNTTTVPSSGFFTGAGGGLGLATGANMSGGGTRRTPLWQARVRYCQRRHTALRAQPAPGLSGIYNTSTLPLGTPALVSPGQRR